jgi:hypothetical protein
MQTFTIPMQAVHTKEDKERMQLVMDAVEKMIAIIAAAPHETHMAILISFIVSSCVNAAGNLKEEMWNELKTNIEHRLPEAIATVAKFNDLERHRPN